MQSTGSLRAKSRDFDDAASLFNYVSKGGPGSKQGGKSILYRMHSKPKKTLNILDGSNRYKQTQDVQRFNEDFDRASMKSYGSLASKLSNKPPLNMRPRSNQVSVLDSIKNRLARTIDAPEDDRQSVRTESLNGRERAL